MCRLRDIFIAIAAALLAAPATVLAAPSGEKTPLDLETGGDAAQSGGGAGIMRTLVGLAIVLAIIFALHWILKQTKAAKEGKASGTGLAAVASLPVGNGRTVQLVRAGREYVLVGVGDGGVTALRRYSEDEAEELGLVGLGDEDEADEPERRGILTTLRELTVIR